MLLHGVPGLGKTLMARTLASTLAMEFRRVQFTPDLMPTDITGAGSRPSAPTWSWFSRAACSANWCYQRRTA
jgi:AAA+ superfamily predicted ATPase